MLLLGMIAVQKGNVILFTKIFFWTYLSFVFFLYSSLRMGQWNSAVIEIDNELADCKILNKNLIYIKREQERTMMHNKDVGRLKILRDDIILQKSLLRDAQKIARENEKGFKKTQEHTNKLKQRH